jgi:hypothetical protein
MQIARNLGYEVREQVIPRAALYVADEVFFTGTAAEITPIRSIDRIKVGAGKRGSITAQLQKEFFAANFDANHSFTEAISRTSNPRIESRRQRQHGQAGEILFQARRRGLDFRR